jgi:hypothetical protein
MVKGLVALDNELERQQRRIEQLESELFFERLRLVGLKTAKEALLSELAVSRRQVKKNG